MVRLLKKNSAAKKSLIASGMYLSLMTLLSRILGLVREMTKAAFLGTSPLADAFNFAFALPNFFRRLFAENSISVAFIPTFRKERDAITTDEDKKRTQEFVSATFTLVTFLTSLVVAAGMFFAPYLIRLFYSDVTVETLPETVVLTRIMFPYLLVISIAAFFQGILNGENIFSPSGFTPVLFNIVVVVFTFVLSPRIQNPARAMAVGVITGGVVQALFQLPFVLKTGWRVALVPLKQCFTNPGTRRVVALIVPTIIGMAAYQLNDFVSASLAGRAGTGVYSSIQYSLRLQELMLGVFAVSIGTVILPDLSGLARAEAWDTFSDLLLNAVKLVALIAIPVTGYSLIAGREIIALLFKTHRFTEESVHLTLGVFRYHIAGLFFIAVNRIVPPAFYAQGNTRLPTLAGLVNFAVNIVLAFTLVQPMRGAGIALALSVASAVNTVCLLLFLRRMRTIRTGLFVKSMCGYTAKIAAYTVLAAFPTVFVHRAAVAAWSGHNRLLSYGVPIVFSAVLFAAIGCVALLVTKDDIMWRVVRRLKQKAMRLKR